MTTGTRGLVHRAHPFTAPALALAVTLLAFALPAPRGPLLLYLAVVIVVLASGAARAVPAAALICLPLWFFLFLLHGVLGSAPDIGVGPLQLSREGTRLALAQAGRFGAIVTATLAMYQGFRPAAFIDAVAQRRWSFPAAYLLVATLTAIPRLVTQAGVIQAAQRSRGLRVRGGIRRRLTGLRALSLPLMFGAIAEVEDRTVALETRAARSPANRTPLDPPPDTLADRALRWLALAAVVGVVVWRLVR